MLAFSDIVRRTEQQPFFNLSRNSSNTGDSSRFLCTWLGKNSGNTLKAPLKSAGTAGALELRRSHKACIELGLGINETYYHSLRMSSSNFVSNRNSTPETSSQSLRPPSSRSNALGHHLRASADMSTYNAAPLSGRSIRPASEMLHNQTQPQQLDAADKAAEQWIAEIDQCENTLEEMAGATTDQDFKAELTAIEEWFRVLSEAERTASLYALLQQATKVQILFFIQTLEEMLRKHPMPGILSSSKLGDQGQ